MEFLRHLVDFRKTNINDFIMILHQQHLSQMENIKQAFYGEGDYMIGGRYRDNFTVSISSAYLKIEV